MSNNDITKRSVAQHIEALGNREYSSLELMKAYIANIDRDVCNVFVSRNDENALRLAAESDKRRAEGKALSALDGIPYAAKDNISVKGLRNTCGSRMLANYVSPYDASVVERLSSLGCIPIGKANMDEFAMGVSTETSHFGVTLNPLDLSRVSGGSSGGSAAAVAADLVPFALGSDTGGSVRQPAAFCGVVGMRPTYGTVSRYGVISYASTMDIVGTVTRNVRDNAIVTAAISGADRYDETSCDHPDKDLGRDIGKSIKGMKIATISSISGRLLSKEASDSIEHAKALLRDMGAEVVEIDLPHLSSSYAVYYIITCAEASSNLARYDGVRYGFRAEDCDSLEELYRRSRTKGFGYKVKDRILFGTLALSAEYCKDFYLSACNMRSIIANEVNEALRGVDALLLSTAPTVAYEIGYSKQMKFEAGIDDILCAPASLAGLPAISVPYREKNSLPVGIQIVGKAFGEPDVYRIASALESALEEVQND